MPPNPIDQPDWAPSRSVADLLVTYDVQLIAPASRVTTTIVVPAATQRVVLHRLRMENGSASTTATVNVQNGAATNLASWAPRATSTPVGRLFTFDYQGVVLSAGVPVTVQVITNFGHTVLVAVMLAYSLY